MSRIRVLPPSLVNRIAAGECVERPASVVKELVENALDAGARRIEIQLRDGGRELIQVSDDGCGMHADDLRLSVEPHATSKLTCDDDLFSIATMGFRGEALASIGSVARLEITSRPRDQEVAQRLLLDAGELSGPAPCTGPVGTSVSVRDLFYCVPARRKFLRTNQTEIGHVNEQLGRIALPHSRVAFTLSHQGRVTHRLESTDDLRTRIADLFGPELADTLLPITRDSGGVCVSGLVAPPAEGRGAGKWEYVFVNGRFVRDRFVSHAVKEAYRSLIDPGRYPVVFLMITIDPAAVDVNVHPTKIEVRWRDSNYVHGQVLAALREKFLQTNLDRRLRPSAPDQDEYRERVRASMVEFFTNPPRGAWDGPSGGVSYSRTPHAGTSPREAPASHEAPGWLAGESPLHGPERRRLAAPSPLAELEVRTAIEQSHSQRTSDDDTALATELSAALHETPRGGEPRAIQLHRTYLVVETGDGLMIIDQHALHERILYEQIRQRVSQRPLESQRLLMPESIPTPPDRHEALETHAATLARLGIELTPSGPQSVALHAFPSFLERVDRAAFVRDLLDRLAEQGARPADDTLLHDILDMMACKAAVKAGDPLSRGEIEALLAQRALAERASNCPHGRPTTLHLTLRDLEKQFKRR